MFQGGVVCRGTKAGYHTGSLMCPEWSLTKASIWSSHWGGPYWRQYARNTLCQTGWFTALMSKWGRVFCSGGPLGFVDLHKACIWWLGLKRGTSVGLLEGRRISKKYIKHMTPSTQMRWVQIHQCRRRRSLLNHKKSHVYSNIEIYFITMHKRIHIQLLS